MNHLRIRSYTIWTLILLAAVLLLVCSLYVQAEPDDSLDTASTSDLTTPTIRLERKQKKQTLQLKRDTKYQTKSQTRSRVSQVNNDNLKRERIERVKKTRREEEKLRRKHEEDIKKKSEYEDPTLRAEAQEKIDALISLTAKSTTRIISVDDSQYARYVLEGNRPYYVMVTYTALSHQNNCLMCHEWQKQLQMVSTQNYDEYLINHKDNNKKELIFFINLDVTQNREIFEQMKLNSAPLILLLPPRLTSKSLKASTIATNLPTRNKYQLQPKNYPHEISQFIHKISNIMININYNAVTFEEYTIGGIFLIILVYVIYRYYDQILKLRYNSGIRLFMCIIGWAVYMWCISGGMYNIIKGNIFSHTDKEKGTTEYISMEPRDQYGAEGLILGFLNIAAGLMLVLVNTRAYNNWANPIKLAVVRPGYFSNIWNTVSPALSPSVCIAGMIFFWLQIVAIYSMKNRGYNRGFLWY